MVTMTTPDDTPEKQPPEANTAVVEALPDEEQAHQAKTSFRQRLADAFSNPKAPLIAGGVLALILAGVGLSHAKLPFHMGRPDVVVFDPVKFLNAQRAAASILISSPNADLSLTLTQVAKQAEGTIRDEARGAIVLVKQSVVLSSDLPDITDAVLTRFGLPTDVPTVTIKPSQMALQQLAPTDNAFSAGKLNEDYVLELSKRTERIQAENQKNDAHKEMLP